MKLPYEWQIGWRYTRAGKRTTGNGFISFIALVSMSGIALGVAVFFAIRTGNATLLDSLHATVEKLAGIEVPLRAEYIRVVWPLERTVCRKLSERVVG